MLQDPRLVLIFELLNVLTAMLHLTLPPATKKLCHCCTFGFAPARSDETPKVRLLNWLGWMSTTEIARDGAVRLLKLSLPTILPPMASVMFRILQRRT